ncbi:AAA family ATPase [Candidatus Bathyarchaeota archaeon]|nr:AAA family ATPase [Candidatus Bathyarchaeota archaeon]
MSALTRVSSGIPGLDEMISGGLPRGRVTLVLGGPGSGKTILGVQFIVTGIRQHDESAVLVSLDEPKQHLYQEMSTLGWDLAGMESEGKLAFVDASPLSAIAPDKESKSYLKDTIESILSAAKAVRAKRIVVDPITALTIRYPDVVQRRDAILRLFAALNGTGATCIVTTEMRTGGTMERAIQLEEYLANSVILLQSLQAGRALISSIQVEKMRGSPHDNQPRPYKITDSGIVVYPNEFVFK